MIDHKTERQEVSAISDHSYGCFEWYAEALVESGRAATGEWDEVLENGMTVVASWALAVEDEDGEATEECHCEKGDPKED